MDVYGWYAYAWAAEPFVVSAIATYVPLFLEQIARTNAVWADDKTTPCLAAPIDNPGLGPPVPGPPPQCVVRMLWGWIDTSSLPLYTFSFSVLVQTVLVISISGIADKGAHRKSLLVWFAVIGALSTMAFYFVTAKHYYVAALCAVIANASFGAVSVCGNSYLPQLVDAIVVREQRLRAIISDRFADAYEFDPVDPAPISAKLSGKGVAIGYASALIVQVVTMFLLYHYSSSENGTFMLQVVTSLVGVWWLVWQIPVVLYLPVSDEKSGASLESPTSLWGDICSGWKSLFKTFAHARKLRDISTFLLGWFIMSDAITTINSTAILFARGNLQMATPSLAGVGLLTVLFGIAGSLFFGHVKFKNPLFSLLIVAGIAAVIPLYGIIGFFSSSLGLKHSWEMFLLAAWYGIALGALNAICRSVYSLLIPRGHETMFFALFSVTDKGSSVVGPAVTGIITDKTHNIRYTFYFLLIMTLLAAIVFSGVDINRGQDDAQDLVEEIGSDSESSRSTGSVRI